MNTQKLLFCLSVVFVLFFLPFTLIWVFTPEPQDDDNLRFYAPEHQVYEKPPYLVPPVYHDPDWEWSIVESPDDLINSQQHFDAEYLAIGTSLEHFYMTEMIHVERYDIDACNTVYRAVCLGASHQPPRDKKISGVPAVPLATRVVEWTSFSKCFVPDQSFQIEMHTHSPYVDDIPIWVIIPLKNYFAYLLRTLDNLRKIVKQEENIKVVIVDFDSTDSNVSKVEKDDLLEIHVLKLKELFSRSKSLDVGIKYIQSRDDSNPQSPVFFLDTSIEIPPDFGAKIRTFTNCNHTVYLPTARKIVNINSHEESLHHTGTQLLQKNKGWFWTQWGYGMISFCLNDYKKVGGINLKFGHQWGGEDADFASSFQRNGFHLIRRRELEYFHNQFKDKKAQSYKKKSNTNFRKPKNLQDTVMVPSHLDLTKRIEEFTDGITPDKIQAIYRISTSPEVLLVRRNNDAFILHNYAGPHKVIPEQKKKSKKKKIRLS
eukprot:gb/GECH01007809.1/.p1 GENE.gb/GECH01007809.1/~~gb/GECH01007809.1/.p1  ORF type:complete len:486 (+),score=72.06 gb/GECH01007809.1/:1-1458(+)